MVVNTQGSRASYIGNGVTTTFSFPNYIKLKSEIKVYVDDVLQTLNTHYTIAGTEPLVSGANIVFTTAPANGLTVKIKRETGLTQSLNLTNSGSFNQEGIEDVLDDLVLKTQDAFGLIQDAQEIVGALSAAESAALAAASATTATAAATTATTQAGIATGAASSASGSASNASSSAASAAASAASASAIAAGSLYAYTKVSGTITAIDGGGYEFNATGTINLPTPTSGYTVRAILASLSTASLTFVPTVGASINGINDSRIVNENGIFFLIADGTGWTLTGSATGI